MAVLAEVVRVAPNSEDCCAPWAFQAAAGASLRGSLPQKKKSHQSAGRRDPPTCPEGECKMPLKCSFLVFPETCCH